jgi:alpha-1,6-mannosyltransferase
MNTASLAPATSLAAVERALCPPAMASRSLDISRTPLPAPLRPDASVGVLDVTKWFGETSGGVRTYLLEKARYVSASPALRQVLVIPGATDSITEFDGVRCYRLRGPRIPFQRPYRFLLASRSIGRIIAHERPTVIEVGSAFLVPWIVRRPARAVQAPLVCFYHSNFPRAIAPFPERAGPARRSAAALAWRYVRTLDRLFALTIVASRFAAEELQRAGVERIAHVPLGVDTDCFHPRRRALGAATRRRLGFPNDVPLVVYVGRLAREKQLDVLLEAWDEIARRTGAHLALVGDGPLRRELAMHARVRDVHWLPYERDRERLASLLAAAQLTVAPCANETFGLAALEALSCGTPVLSADAGGVSELVACSGAGAQFTAGSASALASAAVRLLADDVAALGARGRAYVEREHRWSTVFDRIVALYGNLGRR